MEAALALGLLILATFVGAGLVAACWSLVATLRDERTFLRARVVDLERQLRSHNWSEYAGISQVPSPLTVASEVTNGWGETRREEAFGESPEDQVQAHLEALGLDLDGPTVG
jgi:hypothetical protein